MDFWPFKPPYPVLRRGIVNLTDGKTALQGVIWQRRGQWLVLLNPVLLRSREPKVQLDGEIAIPVGEIQFIQLEMG